MFYPCICLLGIENLTCATAVCRGVEEEWNGRYGRMKNENPEKSLWRSESNAKEFCLKRPCVFLKTLRSFGTNALMFWNKRIYVFFADLKMKTFEDFIFYFKRE